MSDNFEKVYERIRKRIKKRYDRRKEFFSHLASYGFIMVLIWFVVLGFTVESNFLDQALAIFSILWSIGIVIHSVQYTFDELEDRALSRELERAGLPAEPQFKLKREEERYVRLSDDGELVDIDDEPDAKRRAS